MADQSSSSANISLLRDADLPDVATWNGKEFNLRDLIAKLRLFWQGQLRYTGEVCGVMVKAAYRLKNAPQEGKCYDDLKCVQSWGIPNEDRTRDVIFLASPIIHYPLLGKSVADQTVWFRQMEMQYGLPASFFSFGTVQSVSAMMLAHRKATDELTRGYYLVYGHEHYLRTDSRRYDDGYRLVLSWFEDGLFCRDWCWHENGHFDVGCLVGGSLEL